MPTQAYRPEKRFFTDQDFDRMSWHENPVHAIAFGPAPAELSLDIDYIFRKATPATEKTTSSFWISPATLVFEGVFDLKLHHSGGASLTLLGIAREEVKPSELRLPQKFWKWRIQCVEARWEFCATGYRQFIRRPPELVARQRLELTERGDYVLVCPNR